VRLATKGHGGPLKKSVSVTTNVPGSTAPIVLDIRGEIWEPVGYDPRIVAFGQIRPPTTSQPALERRVTITNNLETPADLTDVHCTNPVFAVKTKVVQPGKKFELTVTIVGPLQPGMNYGAIQAATGVDEMPNLSIPVQASRLADVEVLPPELLLPRTLPTELKSQLTIRNHSQTPLDITDLTVSNPALQVEIEEGQDATSYILHLTVPAGTELAATGEKITFKTGLASQPEVAVPIRLRAVPASRPAYPASSPGPRPGRPVPTRSVGH
jgi:hypothetical protein